MRAGLAGVAALAVVLGLGFGTGAALLLAAELPAGLGAADLAALRFTLLQAALSAGASVLAAVPLARALARRRFPGRGAFVALSVAPFLLPALVAALALLLVWGRAGLASGGLAALGLPRLDIYGLPGVVLGHVFLNLPLVLRLLLLRWAAVPAEQFRLAAALGMGPGAVARAIERPILREVLPGAFLLAFVFSAASFAVALALGGGPGATTLELAIWEALRLEADPGRAALLGLLQGGIGLGAGAALIAFGRPAAFGRGLDLPAGRPDAPGGAARVADGAAIVAGGLFLLVPLALLVGRGAAALAAGLSAGTWAAAGTSLLLALGSAGIALLLALPVAALAARVAETRPGAGRAVEALAVLPLAASPLVTATGLWLILRPFADPAALALPLLGLTGGVLAVPVAVRILVPALAAARRDWGPLADALGIAGRARFRLVTLPRIGPDAALAAGLAAALAAGDLGVAALLAPPEAATLPLALQRAMGAYRSGEAAGAALLLLLLCLGLALLPGLAGRRR